MSPQSQQLDGWAWCKRHSQRASEPPIPSYPRLLARRTLTMPFLLCSPEVSSHLLPKHTYNLHPRHSLHILNIHCDAVQYSGFHNGRGSIITPFFVFVLSSMAEACRSRRELCWCASAQHTTAHIINCFTTSLLVWRGHRQRLAGCHSLKKPTSRHRNVSRARERR